MPSSIAAAWVLPISSPPIEGATITVDGGRIVSVEKGTLPGAQTSTVPCVVLPALVNAHTHLELSYLRGRIHRAASFTEWVKPLLAVRRTAPDPDDATKAAAAAIAEAVATGTGLFGDVSNALGSVPALRWSRRPARVFHELLGFNLAEPDARVTEARAKIDAEARVSNGEELRFSLAPHAPYSVSPALFDAIRRDATAHGDATTVHLAESAEEVQLLADGSGPWRELLETLGVWTDAWRPPACSPVAYLQRNGFLDASTLIVHGVHCAGVGSSRVDLQACKLEYSIVSPK